MWLLPYSGPLAAGHGRSEPARGSVTFHFSCVSLPECTEGSGVWDGGAGQETGFAALPSPAAVGEDFSGVSRVGVGGRSSASAADPAAAAGVEGNQPF